MPIYQVLQRGGDEVTLDMCVHAHGEAVVMAAAHSGVELVQKPAAALGFR
jgi:hypothetical protein